MNMKRTGINPSPITLPIVDFFRHDTARNAYVVTFIPEDHVSGSEKETAEIPKGTREAKRLEIQFEALGRLLRSRRKLESISHRGGNEFTLVFAGGRALSFPDAKLDPLISAGVYRCLQDIATTAQVTFMMQRQPVESLV